MLGELPDCIEFIRLMRFRLPTAEIVIELPIENIRIDRLRDLRQAATAAGEHFERKPLFRFILAAQQAMRDWHLSEINDGSQVGRMAEAAIAGHRHTREEF